MMKANEKSKKNIFGKVFKFGVQVPDTEDIKTTRKLDGENKNTLWFKAQTDEAQTIKDLEAFKLILENFDLSDY